MLVEGVGLEAKLVACVVLDVDAVKPSLLEIKRRCAASLPKYMIVDKLHVFDEFPRSRNGKRDVKQMIRMML